MPTIRRAGRIVGHRLVLTDVDRDAAPFIVALRTDPRRSGYIGETPADVQAQRDYIDAYQASRDTAYFIICDRSARKLGTVRLYDKQGDSFSWGSWVLAPDAPRFAAIESAMIVYAYGMDELGFDKAHFAVDIGNERVWRFHQRFGARRVGKNEKELLYEIDRDSVERSVSRYAKYLPNGIVIEG